MLTAIACELFVLAHHPILSIGQEEQKGKEIKEG